MSFYNAGYVVIEEGENPNDNIDLQESPKARIAVNEKSGYVWGFFEENSVGEKWVRVKDAKNLTTIPSQLITKTLHDVIPQTIWYLHFSTNIDIYPLSKYLIEELENEIEIKTVDKSYQYQERDSLIRRIDPSTLLAKNGFHLTRQSHILSMMFNVNSINPNIYNCFSIEGGSVTASEVYQSYSPRVLNHKWYVYKAGDDFPKWTVDSSCYGISSNFNKFYYSQLPGETDQIEAGYKLQLHNPFFNLTNINQNFSPLISILDVGESFTFVDEDNNSKTGIIQKSINIGYLRSSGKHVFLFKVQLNIAGNNVYRLFRVESKDFKNWTVFNKPVSLMSFSDLPNVTGVEVLECKYVNLEGLFKNYYICMCIVHTTTTSHKGYLIMKGESFEVVNKIYVDNGFEGNSCTLYKGVWRTVFINNNILKERIYKISFQDILEENISYVERTIHINNEPIKYGVYHNCTFKKAQFLNYNNDLHLMLISQTGDHTVTPEKAYITNHYNFMSILTLQETTNIGCWFSNWINPFFIGPVGFPNTLEGRDFSKMNGGLHEDTNLVPLHINKDFHFMITLKNKDNLQNHYNHVFKLRDYSKIDSWKDIIKTRTVKASEGWVENNIIGYQDLVDTETFVVDMRDISSGITKVVVSLREPIIARDITFTIKRIDNSGSFDIPIEITTRRNINNPSTFTINGNKNYILEGSEKSICLRKSGKGYRTFKK
jgi:hypothetical protein